MSNQNENKNLSKVNWSEIVFYNNSSLDTRYFQVECPICKNQLKFFEDNEGNTDIEWDENEIITCENCNNNFIVEEWEYNHHSN